MLKPVGTQPVYSLQWRGGNVPARTTCGTVEDQHRRHPSMEGRERSRPDDFAHSRTYVRCLPSMEGRERSRPDPAVAGQYRRRFRPSMEGRERSRPDGAPLVGWCSRWRPFNGGAGTFPPGPAHKPAGRPPAFLLQWRGGNVPARTAISEINTNVNNLLQWRGGNVPARTGQAEDAVDDGDEPSMEGRERSRPDRSSR